MSTSFLGHWEYKQCTDTDTVQNPYTHKVRLWTGVEVPRSDKLECQAQWPELTTLREHLIRAKGKGSALKDKHPNLR